MPVIDFVSRVVTKGIIRTFTVVAGKGARRLATRMDLNDERVMNHMDE